MKKIKSRLVFDKSVKVAIVASKFNSLVVDRLIEGAISTLEQHGIEADNILLYEVPGAFELPLVAQNIARLSDISGVIALGAVIKGATPHFDYVSSNCASGLAKVALDTNKPVSFGVLTTDTLEQALERAGSKAGNKGIEAAYATLEMISLLQTVQNCL